MGKNSIGEDVSPVQDPYGTLRNKSTKSEVGNPDKGDDLEIKNLKLGKRDQDFRKIGGFSKLVHDDDDYVLLQALPTRAGNQIEIGWSQEKFCQTVLALCAQSDAISERLLFELMRKHADVGLAELANKKDQET